jgi:hypothetical protein
MQTKFCQFPAPCKSLSRTGLERLSFITTGENLVPKSSLQNEEGAAREGAARPSRAARGCRGHNSTFASKSRGPCACKGREALHRRSQRAAATLDGPASSSPPPSDALVHAPSHTPSPPATTPTWLVVVPVSYWW